MESGLATLSLSLLLVAATSGLEVEPKWDYKMDANGQLNWAGTCKTGKSQSPIDIDSKSATIMDKFKPLVFEYYDRYGQSAEFVHNGKTAKFIIKSKQPYRVMGGGLPGSQFQFVQGHFHWGMRDEVGSEHLIDNRQYPLELHLVHFNMDRANGFGKAVQSGASNALAVLGIMFELQEEDNKELKPVIDALAKIELVGAKTTVDKMTPLKKFLPRNTDMFFRYNGSLTIPGCEEIVVWTVFKQTLPISKEQLEVFRNIRSGKSPQDEQLGNNFRPVVSLNGRKVYDVDTSKKYFTTDNQVSGISKSTSSTQMLLSAISFIVIFCQF